MISEVLDQLQRLASSVRKNKAVNINSKDIKRAAISISNEYFKNCRGEASHILADSGALSDFDEDWQQLIRLAHGNNAKTSYLTVLKRLIKKTTNLTVASHLTPMKIDMEGLKTLPPSEAERILIETLEQLLPSSARSYRQGLRDLDLGAERCSYRGTACEFRETLREVLDHLAPDSDVEKQSWFKLEQNCTAPTMKQKVRFILSSRGKNKTQRQVAEKSIDLIESLCGDVARAVYNRASVSTHIQTARQEVIKVKRYLDAVLFDVLEIGQEE